MALDQKLKDTEYLRMYSWGKVINTLKKQFDSWTLDKLSRCGYKDFKLAYMPFIMNIDSEGISNNDLAKRCRITKQAMSKVMKELQDLKYIQAKTDKSDKRSILYTLTERGKKIVLEGRTAVKELMDEYRKEIGKDNFDHLIRHLLSIIEYNDNHFGV